MKFYMALQHNLTQALRDISYPINKEELIRIAGDRVIQTNFDKKVVLKEIFEKMPIDSYSCAGELYNNISCVLF